MNKLIESSLRGIFRTYNTTKIVIKGVNEYMETKGYDQNVCFDIAFKQVANKSNVLTKRKEKLLLHMILRELHRRKVYLGEKRDFSMELTRSYLQRGFVYFSDLGLSSDSLFSFFELGKVTPGMYQELKNVHTRWRSAFDEGEDRRQELQRQIFDGLTAKGSNLFFANLP
ncbi:MAG: hypothetical protein QG654_316 [Patescibacteria group bacterium]|jgi:hypothetical protein|nr:hypothetical protein [Patescibacteria group bacterium]